MRFVYYSSCKDDLEYERQISDGNVGAMNIYDAISLIYLTALVGQEFNNKNWKLRRLATLEKSSGPYTILHIPVNSILEDEHGCSQLIKYVLFNIGSF